KPVASVHPEPGSNSSLLLILFYSFQIKQGKIVLNFAFHKTSHFVEPSCLCGLPGLFTLYCA
ncbi:MAG: hypothetical protein K2L28_02685, partial [Muribaculaceae bacterium]|nr:hypothetical protein [Muribaculaceae bacterium]